MSIVCLIKGHKWGDTALDQAIANDWGVFTCKRCWLKLGQAPEYVEPVMKYAPYALDGVRPKDGV